MALTHEELQDFTQFAAEKLSNGGAASILQLASEWQEYRETVAAVREGLADIEAGRVYTAEEVFSEARRNLGLAE